MMQISPTTPVIVGVAQYTERLGEPDYRALSPVDITATAARMALADASETDLKPLIDTVMSARTFEDSSPVLAFPFGRASNFPRSICQRLGIEPERAIWAPSGGDSPQKLVAEACETIARGESRCTLICGGEAMSTATDLLRRGVEIDWAEDVDGQVEDRGPEIDYLTSDELANGLLTPVLFHGLIENARRAGAGCSREEWLRRMAELFAPFAKVASHNPFSASHEQAPTAADLQEASARNRPVADPYLQRLIARDKVNQSAALVVVSTELADQLAIAPERRVYLKGYASAAERPVSRRADIGRAPSAGLALERALESAAATVDDIAWFDFYSCFPVAVSNAIEAIALRPDEPRGLTVTGGLPYFGGPGNNYSMHALAEMVVRLRAGPEGLGLVAANGGFLSKYAVGIYSNRPEGFRTCDSADLTRQVTSEPVPRFDTRPNGEALIETYTVAYDRAGEPTQGIVAARLVDGGARCLARTAKGDLTTARQMMERDPLEATITVIAGEPANHFHFGSPD